MLRLAADFRRATNGREFVLTPLAEGDAVTAQSYTPEGHVTKPPARFSDATLLSAMEGAGKLIDDDELREAEDRAAT